MSLKDWFRSIAQAFGARYVVLTDADGTSVVRRIEFHGGRPFARRYAYDIANVYLKDGGKTSGVCYVESWEPYDPTEEPRWPRYEGMAQ